MMVKLLSATLLMSKAGIFGDVASDMAVAFLALERIRLDLTCGSVAPGTRAPISFFGLNPSCFSGNGAARRGECRKADASQDPRRSGVPGVGDDERARPLMKGAKGIALVELRDGHGDLLRCGSLSIY